jgi:hypothetical protein
MRTLALNAAVNSGTATTAALQLLRGFLTSGTAFLVIGIIHTFYACKTHVVWRNESWKILVERGKKSCKPRTATSQRDTLFLPFAGFDSNK